MLGKGPAPGTGPAPGPARGPTQEAAREAAQEPPMPPPAPAIPAARLLGKILRALGARILMGAPVGALLGALLAALAGALSWVPAAAAGTTDPARELLARALALDGGRDMVARLHFRIERLEGTGGPGRALELTYRMGWRRLPEGKGLRAQAVFFTEAPALDRGKAFLLWIHADGREEQWLYLPQLRTVRRLPPGGHHHGKKELFDRSVLGRAELAPADPLAGRHRLLGPERLEGKPYQRVESRPPKGPYGRVVRWIRLDGPPLVERMALYDRRGRLARRLRLRWQHLAGRGGDRWVWREVVGEDPRHGVRTRLQVEVLALDTGLGPAPFRPRALARGPRVLPGG
ncbi:MAG: outer membrane lipoprotein-sorting protein [Gammaproteobacteria bacterium]|nr:MAG: outer membrane lipoprotein-sorting protein [Gammaproteobacteria bacterium]